MGQAASNKPLEGGTAQDGSTEDADNQNSSGNDGDGDGDDQIHDDDEVVLDDDQVADANANDKQSPVPQHQDE
jgi:hypothetical protein